MKRRAGEDELTKVGTPHKVMPGIFWVCSVHLSGYRVEPGEVVPVEAVIVLQPAKSRGASRQVGPCLGLHRLGAQIVHVNELSCWYDIIIGGANGVVVTVVNSPEQV